MIEHRLIERMIAIIEKKLAQVKKEHGVEPVFIDTAVDFIRTYADRTHHGKEEDVLFRDLALKDLSSEDNRSMKELIEEHVFARKTTKLLVDANTRYRQGNSAALAEIVEQLRTLADFYPRHIEKEDKIFFPASRNYFSEQQDQAMLAEFEQFDRKMIHEKYGKVVESLETA
jgi:hemerythrin-like domain-containing protein